MKASGNPKEDSGMLCVGLHELPQPSTEKRSGAEAQFILSLTWFQIIDLVQCDCKDKMPNKKKNNQAKNPFYFFMISLRPQLERQGVVLNNGMQSLAEIAGPRWKVRQYNSILWK